MADGKHPQKHLSTTALARAIGKDSKELFILLAKSHWIVKVDSHWQLTEKGRFEGGTYVNHPKYGEYIAWPESLKSHPVLTLLPEAPLNARTIGQKWQLPARLVNLALAERGWIKKAIHGWRLTPLGRALGGQQHESDSTAIPYVTWPESLLDNPQLQQVLRALTDEAAPCLDGHSHATPGRSLIDNWLYVAGLAHAVDYPLTVGEATVTVDFYLPAINAAIVYWPSASPPGELAEHLTLQSQLRQSHWSLIEIEQAALDNLDELLSRELLKREYAVY